MTERRPATDAEAKALASALRLRILRICLGEAHTNKEIAAILGQDPASVLHHTRTLVRTGFLEAQEERRGARGAREIPYLATRKSWHLDAPAQDRSMLDAFLQELALAPAAEVDSTRLGLRLPPAEMEEFQTRLRALLEEFAARPDDPTAPAWSLFVVVHPDPNRPDDPPRP
ncbi:ArsR/SmtB family transcription factor [Streptomyces sp. NPDC056105]|uniref:ArsR/SmtB family transcription factor n=1 Tax=Streptomyces sp. NPDC056105 TaxID=3345714 RepID=UPI0035E32278